MRRLRQANKFAPTGMAVWPADLCPAGRRARERSAVVGIPQLVAEPILRIDLFLQREERPRIGIGGEELLAAGVDLVGQVVATVGGDGDVDQLASPLRHFGL